MKFGEAEIVGNLGTCFDKLDDSDYIFWTKIKDVWLDNRKEYLK